VYQGARCIKVLVNDSEYQFCNTAYVQGNMIGQARGTDLRAEGATTLAVRRVVLPLSKLTRLSSPQRYED